MIRAPSRLLGLNQYRNAFKYLLATRRTYTPPNHPRGGRYSSNVGWKATVLGTTVLFGGITLMITRETWPSLKLHERRINELDHPAVQIEEKRAIFRKNVAAMLRQELLIYGGPMQTQDVTDMNTPLRTFWMAQGLQGADTAVYAITLPGDDAPFKMLFIVDIETKDWMAKDDFHTHLLLTVQQGYRDLVVEKAKQKGVPISRKCLSQFVLSDGYFNFFWYDTEERLLRAFDPKERGITLSRGAAGHMEVDIETDGTIQALPRIETVAHEDGVLRLKAG